MKRPLSKGSIIRKTIFSHVFSVSSFVVVLLAIMYLASSGERLVLILICPIFLWFFFVGLLMYGFFGVVICGFDVTNLILKDIDLNSDFSKNKIKIFILFSGELAISTIFFVAVALSFPEAISFRLLFDAIAMKLER